MRDVKRFGRKRRVLVSGLALSRFSVPELTNLPSRPAEAYPPIRILNHFISTLFNLPTVTGSSTLALSLFDYVCDPKSAYQPDMFTVNLVLRHYARKKDLDAIIRLMDRLPSFRLTPDLVTYTTLIGGLLDSGRPDTARGILDVMQKTGVQPNAYVYSLLIADLAKKGTAEAMKSAETLLQQMKAVGLKATAVTWTALASGYFRAHMVKEGLGAIKRSQDKGIELTRVSYNMVLRSILYSDMDAVPAAEIEHFFRGKLGGNHRNLVISNSNTDASLLLLQNMIDNRIEPDLDTWQLVLDSLSRQEKWTQADSVIQLMYSRRFVVKEGSLLARVVQQIRNREKTRRRW
jgi:pentatricopeptide repeat protein